MEINAKKFPVVEKEYKYCLKLLGHRDLKVSIGHHMQVEIPAG